MTSAPRGLRLYLSLRLCLCLCPCLSVPTFSIPPPSLSSHETPLHNLKIVTALSIFPPEGREALHHIFPLTWVGFRLLGAFLLLELVRLEAPFVR